jgi:trk system potassium uptake protein TrkH
VRALAVSFALVILTGTVLLRQPWASVPGRQLAWTEALFTATSATCVTGLVIRPPTDHTVAGQLVIIGLIQVGGLGIVTFGLFFALLAGGRLSLFGRELMLSSLAHQPWEDFWPLLRVVFGATLAIESVGALLLTAAWWGEKGVLALRGRVPRRQRVLQRRVRAPLVVADSLAR